LVAAGQIVTVINTHGEQVVDTWAFSQSDLGEFMSNSTRGRTASSIRTPSVIRSEHRPVGIR